MRKEIKTTEAIFPMPVLMIATYNDSGSVNCMNAAWATMYERDQILLNLTETHKTVKNIRARKAFTVSIADQKHIVEADYFGVVSGNRVENKLETTTLTSEKSNLVDAPIIQEFPICMECVLDEAKSQDLIVGKIVRVSVLDSVLTDEKVDINKLEAICFDPFTHGYYKVGERVGEAFGDGLEIKRNL